MLEAQDKHLQEATQLFAVCVHAVEAGAFFNLAAAL